MIEGKNFINKNWIAGEGDSFQSLNPATDTPIWEGNETGEKGVNAAFSAAFNAFQDWRRLSLEKRISYLKKFSEIVAGKKEDLAHVISSETGKALWDARTEAGAVAGKLDISIRAYKDRTPTKSKDGDPVRTRLTHRPHGVMGVMGPFNFPCHLPNGHIIPALLAGNTVVFKPSPLTPYAGEMMVRFWEEAGLPPGVLNLVQGGTKTGQAMVANEHLRGLLFTGGVPTGKILAKEVAERLDVILALELGGNNPLIIWDVKDLEAAAYITIQSAYITGGQRCTCARRLIVPDDERGEKFLQTLRDKMKGITVGKPDAEDQPFIGSLVSKEAAENVLKKQADLEENGGEVLRRAERLDLGKAFVSPGLVDVTQVKGREDEECFGPLLQVIRVPDFDSAVSEANNTKYGLSAGILTDDTQRYKQFYRDIEAGIVNWNQPLPGASSDAPFGGIKYSGNQRPSAYYAADYSAYPMASLENGGNKVTKPKLPTGLKE